MTKTQDLPEIDELADADYFYVVDASTPATPDKKAPFSKVRPAGARITNHLRYDANITIPALAAGAEGLATITVTGARVGDHVVFNLKDLLPADLAITLCRVSAVNTVQVRFRNFGAGAFASAPLACTASVSRSI